MWILDLHQTSIKSNVHQMQYSYLQVFRSKFKAYLISMYSCVFVCGVLHKCAVHNADIKTCIDDKTLSSLFLKGINMMTFYRF